MYLIVKKRQRHPCDTHTCTCWMGRLGNSMFQLAEAPLCQQHALSCILFCSGCREGRLIWYVMYVEESNMSAGLEGESSWQTSNYKEYRSSHRGTKRNGLISQFRGHERRTIEIRA